MISQKLHNAINAQINAELWSAYLYLSMSMDAQSQGFKGTANWFYVQFQEEQDHALIFMNYLNAINAKVELKAIEPVTTQWATVADMFADTLRHEKEVTALIHQLAVIAAQENDFASSNRLAWFVDEQVEEEESARDLLAAFEAVANDNYGLYKLDQSLSARSYAKASPLK